MAQGQTESEALRAALIEAGDRRRRRSAMALEVERLVAAPADATERDAALRDVAALAAVEKPNEAVDADEEYDADEEHE